MKPKSDTLFHFTKNINFLKSILSNGVMPRYCLEDVRWLDVDQYKFIGYPMVCFCDIPLSRIAEHTGFYGQYGIGLTKDWGLKNKLSPVLYAAPESTLMGLMDYLIRINLHETSDAENQEHDLQIYNLLTRIKPLEGDMTIDSLIVKKAFYQESEWRFVPPPEPEYEVLLEKDFVERKEIANKEVEHHKLLIAPQDVRYIFIKEEKEIPDLVDFINTCLGDFSHNDLKMLVTRIVALDKLAIDI